MRYNLLIILLTLLIVNFKTYSQDNHRYVDELNASIHPTRKITYKKVDNHELKLHILEPVEKSNKLLKPCIIGIHGGGWAGGNPTMVYAILQEFVKEGWIGISIEYRLLNLSKNHTVSDCVKDVKTAIRYVKEHASEIGIDSEQITLSGLSAGGHLALGALLFDTLNEKSDNLAISTQPRYVILYYPVVDTSIKGYGNKKIGDEWLKLSPLHNIKGNLPPILIFHGMKDNVVPIEGVINFQKKIVSLGNSCDLIIHGEGIHGYFLYSQSKFNDVINQTFSFLNRFD
jgi:acetyl esterase/lipase